ncbi:phenylacetate--CoA ligase family protein [Staphylococcus equorum]|uniref:phenylacetate--CoA ligase family protein n=1 Tax=Staphylococcus equorum TaxID=246432 RepID=UPI0008FD9502|nr:phenylacetate--CoA ligase family protein [Staphylococcus equorum]MEB7690489.1 phenylacetate--CoA ligase family protein [Staphylococcus equorum]MEB7852534.1 phenylacetate--CoA ligase family protein [Staphylococcus equorum]OIX98354.1 hypothetical protein BFN02_05035 [Staphylococcus equorum]QQB59153.1 phenylacetate--CoA ligase family protein [Staphylococcus equorum]
MNIRKLAFKILNSKKYKIIKKTKKELIESIDRPAKKNKLKTDIFLDYITSNSTYYKKYRGQNINEIPVITKKEIVDNYNDIATVKEHELNNYMKVTTSGSYGTPLSFYVTKEKKLSQQAEVLFFGSFSNFDLGTKHLYIRVIEPSIKNKIIKNQYVLKPIDINKKWMRKSLNKIKKEKHKVIIAYPSIMNNLAIFALENNIKVNNIEGIITYGEKLEPQFSENIYEAFKCKPNSRYSTEELGVLANTKKNSEDMILNQVNYLIEVLDDRNKPVKKGETGKVVVTDFSSHIVPLVRYDTGDLATLLTYKDGLAHTISNIEGRKIEMVYTTNGDSLMPFNINIMMSKIQGIYQFQFIQESQNKYTLKLLPKDNFDKSILEELENKYKQLLGLDALIDIIFVDEIETLKSGKRPYIINHYKK